jgi:EpsI family protein
MTGTTRYALTILFLAGAAGALALTLRRQPDTLATPLSAIGEEIGGWVHVDSEPLDGDALDRLHPTDYLARTYRLGEHNLALFVAYYSMQRAGESIHSPRNCLPGNGWEIWKYDEVLLPAPSEGIQINRFFIQNQGRRMVVYYWYQSHGRVIADEYWGKILLIRDTLATGRTSGALVRIAVDDAPETAGRATEFAATIAGRLQQCFR